MKDKKAEIAFTKLQDLKRLTTAGNVLFFELGKQWKEFRDNEYHIDLGYPDFKSLLGSEHQSVSTVYAYIGVYEFWIEEQGYKLEEASEVGWNRLMTVMGTAKQLKDPSKVDDLFEKARTLTNRDLKIEIGKADEDGNFKSRIATLRLCDKCKGYIIPPSITVCKCESIDSTC